MATKKQVETPKEEVVEETPAEEAPAEGTLEGTVKWFDDRKGYGFITGSDGQDYFVHHTAIPEGTRIREGDKVTFEPSQSEKGRQAKNVKKE